MYKEFTLPEADLLPMEDEITGSIEWGPDVDGNGEFPEEK